MSRRFYCLLFWVGLVAVSSVAAFQRAPGYMDADYYYAGGLRLASGAGFSENFLWNYLDDPSGLPHPSYAYWMPLASLLAAAGMKLTGMMNFNGARLGFLFVAALVPPLTAALSYQLSARRDFALFAGLLAAFPAFYLSYQGTTDNFAIYMLLGGLWFLVLGLQVGRLQVGRLKLFNLQPYLLGLLAGLMHLSRADGIIWLFLSFAVVFLEIRDWRLELGERATASSISTLQSPFSILQSLFPIPLHGKSPQQVLPERIASRPEDLTQTG